MTSSSPSGLESITHSIEAITSAFMVVAVNVTLSNVGSLAVMVEPSVRNATVGSAVSRPICTVLAAIGTICAPA